MLRFFGFHVTYRQEVPCTYIVETILKESNFFEFSLKFSFLLACHGLGIYPQSVSGEITKLNFELNLNSMRSLISKLKRLIYILQ